MILVFGQIKKKRSAKIPQNTVITEQALEYLPCASLGMTRLRLLFFLYFAKGIDATTEIGLFRFSYCMILVVGLEVCKLGQFIGEKIKHFLRN